jgi:stearoyl-CoA desaturase (delta-9 desaturase)
VNLNFLYGILNLSFWGYVLVTFLMIQVTFMGVTLYLHRDATHRSLDLHPVLRHFFRFWLWIASITPAARPPKILIAPSSSV